VTHNGDGGEITEHMHVVSFLSAYDFFEHSYALYDGIIPTRELCRCVPRVICVPDSRLRKWTKLKVSKKHTSF